MDICKAVVFKQIGAKIAYHRTLRVLSRIERGKYNENISVSILLDIAQGLDIDLAMLVTFDEHEKRMWENGMTSED